MPNLQELFTVLNESASARAIVDFEDRSFIAWNPKFLEHTGFSEAEMKTSKPEELLTFGESWFPLSKETGSKKIEYIACAVRRLFGADPAPGFVIRSHDKIGYVMLDVFDSPSAQFQEGHTIGREAEHNRIKKAFHNEVSSPMMAALFLIEAAKIELEKAGSPQAEAVSKASDLLAETAQRIANVLNEGDNQTKS